MPSVDGDGREGQGAVGGAGVGAVLELHDALRTLRLRGWWEGEMSAWSRLLGAMGVRGGAWVHTVRNGAVVGFLEMAVVREGVGDAGQVGLVHFFGDGVVEALVR